MWTFYVIAHTHYTKQVIHLIKGKIMKTQSHNPQKEPMVSFCFFLHGKCSGTFPFQWTCPNVFCTSQTTKDCKIILVIKIITTTDKSDVTAVDKVEEDSAEDSQHESEDEEDSDVYTDYAAELGLAIEHKKKENEEAIKDKILAKLTKYKDLSLAEYGTC